MADERTQEPSRHRRQLARSQGQAAQSPALTAAAGLLAAVALLGAFGDEIASAMAAGFVPAIDPAGGSPWPLAPDPAAIVGRVRGAAWALAMPLGGLLLGTVAAAVAAHQAQVGGLWAPGLIAPDLRRLVGGGPGGGAATRLGRGIWGLSRSAALVAAAVVALATHRDDLARLARLDPPRLLASASGLAAAIGFDLAIACLALGLADFVAQARQFEARLRTTPDEHREEVRAAEGDPALRARRRQRSRTWIDAPAVTVVPLDETEGRRLQSGRIRA